MSARTLPVWADLARVDAAQDARLQEAMKRPPARRQRQPLGIQPASWIASRPIVAERGQRRGLRQRVEEGGSLSPGQRWKLNAKQAAAELEAEAA